jgi:hypothetical protein
VLAEATQGALNAISRYQADFVIAAMSSEAVRGRARPWTVISELAEWIRPLAGFSGEIPASLAPEISESQNYKQRPRKRMHDQD